MSFLLIKKFFSYFKKSLIISPDKFIERISPIKKMENDTPPEPKENSINKEKPRNLAESDHSLIQVEATNEDHERAEIFKLCQKQYKDLMEINSEIKKKYWYTIWWINFCLGVHVVFTITFFIYFMNPKDPIHEPIVLLGVLLFLLNSSCFVYGKIAMDKKCSVKTLKFTKLSCLSFVLNASLVVLLIYTEKQVGVIPSGFGSFSHATFLIGGRGIEKHFLKREKICSQLQPIIETYAFDFNLEV